MANDINIQKTVFSTTEFGKVVNSTFSTFTQPVPEEDTDTPEELFRLYEKLYYVIDVTGETDSHEYLVKKSSELLTFDRVTEDIQPLLDEIAQLREENLALNQQVLTLETNIA
tara:strand:- start:13720 stop:14058 length:339 start_codon:yes stop_codon:yes gene_type:complete